MKNYLRAHGEVILAAAGIFLGGCLLSFLIWGVGTLADRLGGSLANPGPGAPEQGFDIEGAAQLDFKGLR